MSNLIPVEKTEDIFPEYQNTPVGKLFEYHNIGRRYDIYTKAELLIGMCMDNRKHLRIPDNFAFIIRTGGANLKFSEFKVSFAIAVGGVSVIALIGHTQCGMVNLVSRREQFIQGLVERAGWTLKEADEQFRSYAPAFEIHNETDFIIKESQRLRIKYPKILIAPLLYKVEDNLLYQISF